MTDATATLNTVVGLLVAVGFCGAVVTGMAWAFCAGFGLPTDWPKGLTMMFLVPLGAGFLAAQFLA